MIFNNKIFGLIKIIPLNLLLLILKKMKLYNLLLTFALFAVFTKTIAQQKTANISFETTSYSFGTIKEVDGPVTYKFAFTNIGAAPLIISNVQASCGCTTPNWTKEPVLPGAKGFVIATFDPRGRIGAFNKTVTVNYNGDPATVLLSFNGEVVENKYPYQFGELKGKAPQLTFGNVYIGQPKTEQFELMNPTSKAIKLECYNLPKYIKVLNNPLTIEAGQTARIEAVYDAAIKNDYGFTFDNFMIKFNDSETNSINLVVSSNLMEDFSKLTEKEKQNAPKVLVPQPEFNFVSLKSGDKVSHKYTIRNVGKSDLKIRKVVPSCGCTTVEQPTKGIAPGDSISIPIEFNSSGKSGEQNKTIQVYTNDPTNPRLVLWIKGTITAPEGK